MRIIQFIYTVTIFVILLTSCSSSTTKKETSRTKTSTVYLLPTFKKPDRKYILSKRPLINSFFNENLRKTKLNGMFLVAKNGHILYEQYAGYANVSSKQKINSSTPLHLASISKVATSLAILRLNDQKKLLLDEDVRNFLPELPYEGISIRMLLNHRSGIPYYGYFTYKLWPTDKQLTNRDLLKLLAKHQIPLNFKPDSHFTYCNTNFALLALIVEKVQGCPFPQAMKQLIFDPLKMDNSFIFDGSFEKEKLSQSYNSRMINQSYDYLDDVYGDKNMYSTARDLLKMDRGTYDARFLSKKATKEIYRGYSYENSGSKNYGLGYRMVEEKGKSTYFFHTGWWHGNTGCYASLRADTVCVIALSNVFNRSVYRINRLSLLFGDYPFEFDDEE